jgi:hypothetical protein
MSRALEICKKNLAPAKARAEENRAAFPAVAEILNKFRLDNERNEGGIQFDPKVVWVLNEEREVGRVTDYGRAGRERYLRGLKA